MQNTYALEVLWLFLVLLLLMCLGRAVFVFPLSWAHNWWSRERLSLRDSVIIWCAPVWPAQGLDSNMHTLARAAGSAVGQILHVPQHPRRLVWGVQSWL